MRSLQPGMSPVEDCPRLCYKKHNPPPPHTHNKQGSSSYPDIPKTPNASDRGRSPRGLLSWYHHHHWILNARSKRLPTNKHTHTPHTPKHPHTSYQRKKVVLGIPKKHPMRVMEIDSPRIWLLDFIAIGYWIRQQNVILTHTYLTNPHTLQTHTPIHKKKSSSYPGIPKTPNANDGGRSPRKLTLWSPSPLDIECDVHPAELNTRSPLLNLVFLLSRTLYRMYKQKTVTLFRKWCSAVNCNKQTNKQTNK